MVLLTGLEPANCPVRSRVVFQLAYRSILEPRNRVKLFFNALQASHFIGSNEAYKIQHIWNQRSYASLHLGVEPIPLTMFRMSLHVRVLPLRTGPFFFCDMLYHGRNEEARTPDFCVISTVLCLLSYVPILWSRIRDLNPHCLLGRQKCYHYTNATYWVE